MSSPPPESNNVSPAGSPDRPLDVRSRWVVMASWVGFGVGVALFLLPAAGDGLSVLRSGLSGSFAPPGVDSLLSDGFWGVVVGPLLSWLLIRPLAGRLAAAVEAFILPVYRAFAWKPERFDDVYDKPLPGEAPKPVVPKPLRRGSGSP